GAVDEHGPARERLLQAGRGHALRQVLGQVLRVDPDARVHQRLRGLAVAHALDVDDDGPGALLGAPEAGLTQTRDEQTRGAVQQGGQLVLGELGLDEQPHAAVELERPPEPADPDVAGRRGGRPGAPHSSSWTSTRWRPSAAARARVRTALVTRPPDR